MEHLLEQLLVWWIHLWPRLLTAAILVIDLVLSIHAPRDRLEVPRPLEGVRLPTL